MASFEDHEYRQQELVRQIMDDLYHQEYDDRALIAIAVLGVLSGLRGHRQLPFTKQLEDFTPSIKERKYLMAQILTKLTYSLTCEATHEMLAERLQGETDGNARP